MKRKMKIVIKTATRASGVAAVAAAMVSAGLLLALAVTPREAEATFPGEDGRIAFASNRTTGEGVVNPEGDFEIFTMNLDGTGLQQLTKDAARELHPDYAPNGKKIAFVSERNFQPGIYTMNADGTEQLNLTNEPAGDFTPTGSR